MRCQLCGAEKHEHYDGEQCPVGPNTWSSTQRFAGEPSNQHQINSPITYDYTN